MSMARSRHDGRSRRGSTRVVILLLQDDEDETPLWCLSEHGDTFDVPCLLEGVVPCLQPFPAPLCC